MAEICVGTIPTKNIGGTGEGPYIRIVTCKSMRIHKHV